LVGIEAVIMGAMELRIGMGGGCKLHSGLGGENGSEVIDESVS
jgi:hypothetical protein